MTDARDVDVCGSAFFCVGCGGTQLGLGALCSGMLGTLDRTVESLRPSTLLGVCERDRLGERGCRVWFDRMPLADARLLAMEEDKSRGGRRRGFERLGGFRNGV
jgi:hypothetical protein